MVHYQPLCGECYDKSINLPDVDFSLHTHICKLYSKIKGSNIDNTYIYTINNGRICFNLSGIILSFPSYVCHHHLAFINSITNEVGYSCAGFFFFIIITSEGLLLCFIKSKIFLCLFNIRLFHTKINSNQC